MRKSKGRQKTKMVKMEKENNLQVTFSKRKNGLFKKASELCTLCDVHIAIIVFSPSGKAYSFGHPKVETIIDRFKNNDPQPIMQLDDINRNSEIRGQSNHLTEVMNNLESEQKKNEDLKKIRKESKMPDSWLKKSIGGLDLGQAKEFKAKLENLKKQLTHEALRILQENYTHPSFHVGSSSNALLGVDSCINIKLNLNPFDSLNPFDQRRRLNMNNFYNQNMVRPSYPLPYGNSDHAEGFVLRYNYIPEPNPNENQNPSSKEENEAGNENHHDGHHPRPRSD